MKRSQALHLSVLAKLSARMQCMANQNKNMLLVAFAMAFYFEGAMANSLTELSFEELLSLEVTSVAKKPQRADEASAAIFVITQEDIKKSGVTTIPELLRLAPGLEVGSIDASNTAVSARGFNWRFSNKLLVLVDGRAVYQSLWSGVLWDQQLIPTEDIDRIEVIRGPGATLYGANAVNGVINIVTKHAVDTLGGLATLQGGVATVSGQGAGRFFARKGARLGERGAFRLYVTGRDEPSLVDESRRPFNDGARALQTGFRVDWEPNDLDAFTLQGDYQTLDFDVTLTMTPLFGAELIPNQQIPTVIPDQTTRESASGYNVLGRWTRSWSRENTLALQAYFDHTERSEFALETHAHTIDVDISHYFSWGGHFETVWGAGYRAINDEARSFGDLSFQQPVFGADLFSAFLQQGVKLFGERLRVSLGSKFEHNDFTGFEVQPSIRAIWVDHRKWSFWGAISRAVRTPSRLETSLDVDLGRLEADPLNGAPLPVEFSLLGDPGLEAEDLLAFEAGVRKDWGGWAALDIAGYVHKYDDLFEVVTREPQPILARAYPGPVFVPVGIDQSLGIANGGKGNIVGLEAALQLQPTPWWKVFFAGDLKRLRYPTFDARDSSLNALFLGDSPQYQLSLRSDIEATSDLSLTLWARRVGALTQSNTSGYTDLDFRASYRLSSRFEIRILGENLIKDGRQEFPSDLYPAPFGFIERRISGALSARF